MTCSAQCRSFVDRHIAAVATLFMMCVATPTPAQSYGRWWKERLMAFTETARNRISSRMGSLAFTLAVFALLSGPVMLGQNYQIIHTFSGGGDGATPDAGLTPDGHGNYYGTAYSGGAHDAGTVFKITPHGSSWVLSTLYSFTGSADGGWPTTGVTFGPDGTLYGASSNGTTVYNLRPSATRPSSVLAEWTERALYQFQGIEDGFNPSGNLIFDHSGNIYGAMEVGGQGCYEGCGLIYKLSPSGQGWEKSVVYNFQGGVDGEAPEGIIFDPSGNIVGITIEGGQNGVGAIFELTPSSGGWNETTLYSFAYGSGGNQPATGLVEDAVGNFYGGTLFASGDGGVIFELSPSDGGWVYTVLYNFPGCGGYGTGPKAPLTLDAAGNLYGTFDGYYNDCPAGVFKLSPGQGGWTYTSLHNFTGGSDGAHPYSSVSIDPNGNLFGTASAGGEGCYSQGCGVVWEITP
jgi:uncharacterized repeat protein (TIGR03803 family)